MPWREDLVEQLDWLAQEVDEQGGDAWVMRVGELSEAEHRRAVDEIDMRRRMARRFTFGHVARLF